MKQPQDNKTLELELDGKRGRGRPPKADALTPAERAKRYRDNQRAIKAKVRANMAGDVTEMREAEADLVKRVHELAAQLRQAHQTIDGLRKEQELLIQERTNAFKAYDDMCIQWEQAHEQRNAATKAYDELKAQHKHEKVKSTRKTVTKPTVTQKEQTDELFKKMESNEREIKKLLGQS